MERGLHEMENIVGAGVRHEAGVAVSARVDEAEVSTSSRGSGLRAMARFLRFTTGIRESLGASKIAATGPQTRPTGARVAAA